MPRPLRKVCRLLPICLALALVSLSAAVTAQHSVPYQVNFPNSCDSGVQQKFSNAVTLLHSFEYPESTRLFAEISAEDPGCAMARWGSAMSMWNPLWAPPGKEQLEAGMGLLDSADGLNVTDRERAYIDALKAFFSSNDARTHMSRARAYEERMHDLYLANLDDPEAAVFYALALLATHDPRDKSYANQFRAAGVLNWVRTSQPGHPGVMHYLIHSYDYPGLAHLALDVAKTYAKAAPNSAHAQHMPSHIFTRLGLWELSLSSNHDSIRSAADYTKRAQLPGHYDEGLHSMDYLMYALLQTARDEEARALLATLADIDKTDTENFKVAFTYAASPARYVLERRAWVEASHLQLIRPDFAWDGFGWAKSIHHFARGLGAARSGNLDAARREVETIMSIQSKLPGTTLPYWREQVQVHIDSVLSWITLVEGRESQALEMAVAAAEREDAVDKHPVTPGEVLPARELYADMLFQTGKYTDALSQYQTVLKGSPNRLNALIGVANSAAESGEDDLADEIAAVIRQQTKHGNRQHSGLSSFVN